MHDEATQAPLSKYSNVSGGVENKATWMAGMTSLFPLLLHYIHITTHFLLHFVFQSDPDTGGTNNGVFYRLSSAT